MDDKRHASLREVKSERRAITVLQSHVYNGDIGSIRFKPGASGILRTYKFDMPASHGLKQLFDIYGDQHLVFDDQRSFKG